MDQGKIESIVDSKNNIEARDIPADGYMSMLLYHRLQGETPLDGVCQHPDSFQEL